MKSLFPKIIVLLFLILPFSGKAQYVEAQTDVWRIITVQGTVYYGEMVERSKGIITLKLDDGSTIQIPESNVREMKRFADEELVNRNSEESTRRKYDIDMYGLSGGARGPGRKEGYYRNTGILINQVNYGFTDALTLDIKAIYAITALPMAISLKYEVFDNNQVAISATGGVFLNPAFIEDADFFVMPYIGGKLTLGEPGRNITVGFNQAFYFETNEGLSTLSIAGQYRTGPKFGLVGEVISFRLNSLDGGTFDSESFTLASFGVRFYFKKNMLDFSLISPFSSSSGVQVVFPGLAFTVPFE